MGETRRASVHRDGRGRGAWIAGLLLLGLFVARPLVWGASLSECARFMACVLVFVALPGWSVWPLLRRSTDDGPTAIALSLGLGLLIHTVVWIAAKAAHAELLFTFSPLAFALLAWRTRRVAPRADAVGPPALTPKQGVVLVLLLAVALLRVQLRDPVDWTGRVDSDLQFHAGNAAALVRGFPLMDPRLAGLSLNYHVLGYPLYCAARETFGIPIEALFSRVAVAFVPVLAVSLCFVTARELARSARAGLVAAALMALHADPGAELARAGVAHADVLLLQSPLYLGLYASISTPAGFACTALLIFFLARWCEGARRRDLFAAALAAGVASGAKGSVMPILGGALVLAAVIAGWRAWRLRSAALASRELAQRLVLATIVIGIASVPATCLLLIGDASYGGAMFRVIPWHAMLGSGFFEQVCALTGVAFDQPPTLLRWIAAPFWLALYLGPAGWLAAFELAARARTGAGSIDLLRPFLAACAALGILAGCLLGAPGISQLFFTYTGQLALAVLAGAWCARAGPVRLWRWSLLAPSLLIGGAVAALATLHSWRSDMEEARRSPPTPPLLYDASLWLREHTPPDAVLVSNVREELLPMYAERVCVMATDSFAAAAHARNWARHDGEWEWIGYLEPVYPERARLREALLTRPDREALIPLRAEIGSLAPLYIVRQHLPVRRKRPSRPLEPYDAAAFEQVFVQGALEILHACDWP